MKPRLKLRWISAIQVLTGLIYVASMMFTLTTAASVTREEAMHRLGQDLPADMHRVFINHRVAYAWPFGKGWCIPGGIMGVVSFMALFGSVWWAHRVKDEIARSPGQ